MSSFSKDGDLPLSAKPDKPAPDPFGGAPAGGPTGGAGAGGGPYFAPQLDPMATASLVTGVLSLLFLCCCGLATFLFGPVAVGLGIWSIVRIKGDPQNLTGDGMAYAGIGLGAISLLLQILLMVFYVGVNVLGALAQ
ncbi:MAG: DUF4190 domain-containing protein [Pseudomonadota bacterium]